MVSSRCADRGRIFVIVSGRPLRRTPCGTGTLPRFRVCFLAPTELPSRRTWDQGIRHRQPVFGVLPLWRKTLVFGPKPECDRLGPRRAFRHRGKSPLSSDPDDRSGFGIMPPLSDRGPIPPRCVTIRDRVSPCPRRKSQGTARRPQTL